MGSKGKQMGFEPKQVFLKPDEAAVVVLSLLDFIQTLKETEHYNWSEETLKMRKDQKDAAYSLRAKLSKLGFDVSDLPPYEEGDEKEFLKP